MIMMEYVFSNPFCRPVDLVIFLAEGGGARDVHVCKGARGCAHVHVKSIILRFRFQFLNEIQ